MKKYFFQNKWHFIIITFLLIQGCARYQVRVESIKNHSQSSIGKKYILLSGSENIVVDTDLQFQEFSKYIDVALKKIGYFKANSANEADIAIFMLYGIGDPERVNFSYSFPVYGQISGGSSSFNQTTLNSSGRFSTSYGSIRTQPQYGVVGSQSVIGTRIEYFRYFILDAVDVQFYKTAGKIIPIWKTTVTSRGSSDDLRRVFPYLVIASEPYIGSDTGRKISIEIYEDDSNVRKLVEK